MGPCAASGKPTRPPALAPAVGREVATWSAHPEVPVPATPVPLPTAGLPSAARRHLVLGDLLPAVRFRDAALVVGGAALVGGLAQVSLHIPGTPVPVTGQTFGVLLAGAALGPRRAAASMALYVVAGVAGMPWFASGGAGMVGASFGYLLAYPLAAAVVGALSSRRGDRTPLRTALTMAAGSAVVYAVGVTWLATWAHLGAGAAIREGMVPFLAGDAVKLAAAAAVLPATWKLVGRD